MSESEINNNLSNEMSSIASRIKKRREELKLSYQDLANLTGLTKSTLQRYEKGGIKNIPLDKLNILSDALQIAPEYILGWTKKASLEDNLAPKEILKHALELTLEKPVSPEEVDKFLKVFEILSNNTNE